MSRGSSSAPTITRRTIRANGHPGAGIGISLEPGANALRTANLVKAKVAEIAPRMPEGYAYAYANDTSDFIKLSVWEVVKTLFEAILLVVLVIFVFLQSWRATLVPFIAVPVVLLGTFAILYALGFSINTMTLFGLVLATGLLVDDAIVVVENVERLMDENPEMSPRDATIASMSQIQMALIGIALVLSAVFLPMVFFGGSTGVIYRQFSATIVSAMGLSIFIALTLSPAIAANLLRRTHATVEQTLARTESSGGRARHRARTSQIQRGLRPAGPLVCRDGPSGRRPQMAVPRASTAACWCCLSLLFVRLPTGFLPTEDQGAALVQFRLPAGATMTRTREVQLAVENYFLNGPEKKNVKTFFTVAGGGQGAAGPEYRPGVHQPRRLRPALGQAEFGRRDRRSAPPRRSVDCATRRSSRWCPARSAASASRPASPWSSRTPAA